MSAALAAELPRLHPADLAALADMIAERMRDFALELAQAGTASQQRPVVSPTTHDPEDPCDLVEAARLAGCSTRTMRRHIKAGRVHAWRVGADPTSEAAPLRIARGDALALRGAGAVEPGPAAPQPDPGAPRGPRKPRPQDQRAPRSVKQPRRTSPVRASAPRGTTGADQPHWSRAEARETIRSEAAAVRERLNRLAA